MAIQKTSAHYSVLNGKTLYLIISDSIEGAKDWAVNHLDCSQEIIVREIEIFFDVNSGLSNL